MLPLHANDPRAVGGFRVVGRLGAGGMGRVFLAAGRGGTPVALKVVHAQLAHDAQFRARFRREVEIGRRVVGPWTAAVVGADPAAALPWLASEYVPGPSLEHVVDTAGPLTVPAAHVVAAGMARALQDIHGAGVVHRDVKASNVLLAADRPRLVDFGLSRALDGTQVTATGAVIGTPAFMSPEQAAGEEAGPASDVFSLAAVVVYALTGRGPFGDGAPFAVLLRIADEEPDLAGVPDPLREPIARCLAKAPGDRPTAAELIGLLDPVPASAPRMWLPAPAAALALGLDVDGDGVRAEAGGGRQEPAEPAPAVVGGQRALRLSRRSILVGAGLLGTGVAGGLATRLLTGSEAAPPPAGPRVRWTYEILETAQAMTTTSDSVYIVDSRVLYAIGAGAGAQRWNAPSATGPDFLKPRCALRAVDDLVIGDLNGVMTALDQATGEPRWTLPDLTTDFDDALDGVGIAAAGGLLFVAVRGELRAIDVVSGTSRWSRPLAARFQRSPVAGSGACVATGESGVDAFDAATGSPLWRYDTGPTQSSALAMADGVVFRTDENRTLAIDLATGESRWEAPVGLRSAGEWDHSRPATGDGAVYVLDTEGQVHALDAATGSVRWTHPDVTSSGGGAGIGPVFADGTVYAGVHNGRVYAVDSRSGRLDWEYFSAANGMSGLAATGGTVFASFASADPLVHGDRVEAIEPPTAGSVR